MPSKRPLSWTERVEAKAGLSDLVVSIYTTQNEIRQTVVAVEESPGSYRAYLSVDRDDLGSTLILEWKSKSEGRLHTEDVIIY